MRVEDYQKHLDGVSRSFAFCIRELSGAFREHVSLAYLLFRLLDCVEDYPWSRPEDQQKAFASFHRFLKSEVSESQYEDWLAAFPPSSSAAENDLLRDGRQLFCDLHGLPSEQREIFEKHLLNMSRGMAHFAQNKITSLPQLNAYCFFVAGLIGEFLSEIYSASYPQVFDQRDLVNATHFGLFLQKINILKDQRTDESEGRRWIVERDRLARELAYNSLKSFEYLDRIHSNSDGYKTFCAWSLFIGLASYPYIVKGFEQSKTCKIPRAKTLWLTHRIKKHIEDQERSELHLLFSKLMEKLPAPLCPPGRPVSPEVFSLYEGALSAEDLGNLNLGL